MNGFDDTVEGVEETNGHEHDIYYVIKNSFYCKIIEIL